MVYDGADGHYSVVEKFIPPGNEGNIMITSRGDAGLKRLTQDSVNVLDMADDEAVLLLLKSAMLDGTSDHIKNMAQRVVLEMGGIPLALDQAGAYMQNCGCSIDDYFCYNRSSFLRLPFDIPYMPVFFFYDVLNLL